MARTVTPNDETTAETKPVVVKPVTKAEPVVMAPKAAYRDPGCVLKLRPNCQCTDRAPL